MTSAKQRESEEPFGPTLRALLQEDARFTSASGRVSWSLLAKELPTVGYDTLRKAVSGGRRASPELIEEVSATIGVDPDHFAEYRLHLARAQFDARIVGWEQALTNLRRFGALQDHSPSRRSSVTRSHSASRASAEVPAA